MHATGAAELTGSPASPEPKPPSRVTVRWAGGMRFDGGREDRPTARLDGSGETGQSPPEGLLTSLASCAAIDVVEIMAKRRTPVQSLEVRVVGERVDTLPRRFKQITLNFSVAGPGIDKEQLERAIDLSVNKYCSVRDSLRTDIPVDWTLEITPTSPAASS